MEQIVTLTLNPSIDGAAEAEKVRPIHKIRTWGERYDPGGGGINASRVIQELGGATRAIYLSGGYTGPVLDGLVDAVGLPSERIRIAGHTRISHTVHEHETRQEFRFVPQGPDVSEEEWRRCLAALEGCRCRYLLASGSLPRGVPVDFYRKVGEVARKQGAHFVVDTSGDALKATLADRVHLVKPSLGELEGLLGQQLRTPEAQYAGAAKVVRDGMAEIVALTLGRDGAVLATADGLWRIPGISVPTKSAVGAGDSFLASMTLALSRGAPPPEAFAWGVAAGTAAVMTMGTELCRREDVEAIYRRIQDGGGPQPVTTAGAGRG